MCRISSHHLRTIKTTFTTTRIRFNTTRAVSFDYSSYYYILNLRAYFLRCRFFVKDRFLTDFQFFFLRTRIKIWEDCVLFWYFVRCSDEGIRLSHCLCLSGLCLHCLLLSYHIVGLLR